MKKYLLIYLGIFLLSAANCRKDKSSADPLPPATQEGKNIFACLLNGQPWISRQGLGNLGATVLRDSLGIHGSRRNADNAIEDIYLDLFSVFKSGTTTYSLGDTVHAFANYIITGPSTCLTNTSGYGGGGTKKSTSGSLVLTKVDTVNKILSGTFNFTLLTDHCDTFHFTDGRFDIKFQ